MSDRLPPRTPPRPAPTVVVALPGAGSDGDYAARAFGPLATWLDVPLVAVEPASGDVVAGHHRALARACRRHGPVLAAGVSIGACAAVDWAVQTRVADAGGCAGVVAAMPPWVADETDGRPPPAAVAARVTAAAVADLGLERAIDEMSASSPDWLATELGRSWAALGAALPTQLLDAARANTPTSAQLRALRVPVAVVAVADDPLHPVEVAVRWDRLLPTSLMTTVSFDAWGADPGVLGRAARASGLWNGPTG